MSNQSNVCPTCNGTGWIDDRENQRYKQCKHCSGIKRTGRKSEPEKLKGNTATASSEWNEIFGYSAQNPEPGSAAWRRKQVEPLESEPVSEEVERIRDSLSKLTEAEKAALYMKEDIPYHKQMVDPTPVSLDEILDNLLPPTERVEVKGGDNAELLTKVIKHMIADKKDQAKQAIERLITERVIAELESLKQNYWSLEDDRGDVLQDFYIDNRIQELKGTIEQ